MAKTTKRAPAWTLGIDLGDRRANYCWLNAEGQCTEEGEVPQTVEALSELVGQHGERVRVAFEAGTHSGWVSDHLEDLGHQVLVANGHRLKLIAKSKRKTDRADAELLARIARSDPLLLNPIRHRGKVAREHLQLLRSRSALVDARTQLVNHVRGAVKAHGSRIPTCSTHSFAKTSREHVPEALRTALLPVLDAIESLSARIRGFDRRIDQACQHDHPETALLQQVAGVGPITALCYVLTLDDPDRFSPSRMVGAYLGLVPRARQSGKRDPELGITKAGDGDLRRLLVSASHYILGPFGPDTDLRRFGEELARRGGKNAKKRAVVAVARKLSVLLHSLWKNASIYEPLRHAEHRTRVVSSA